MGQCGGGRGRWEGCLLVTGLEGCHKCCHLLFENTQPLFLLVASRCSSATWPLLRRRRRLALILHGSSICATANSKRFNKARMV